jgi:hypothetical protein
MIVNAIVMGGRESGVHDAAAGCAKRKKKQGRIRKESAAAAG